jgi:anti-anti-sigma factor
MRITRQGDTLNVSEVSELATTSAESFQSAVHSAMSSDARRIEIDLSQTSFVDCRGLGALVAVRKCARNRSHDVTVRLLNPPQLLQRMIMVMRMDSTFEIENRNLTTPPAEAPLLDGAVRPIEVSLTA